VRSTAEIGPFVILNEGSVGSGARRIEAVTAGEAWEHLHGRARELDDVRAELEQARREAKKPKKAEVQADVEPEIERVGETNVIVMEVPGVGGQELLDLSDRFKQRSAPAAIVLGSREDGTANLVVNFDDAVAAKLSAGDVVKAIAPIVGGGGGGRPTMARAGGKDPDNLPTALARARELLSAALS
jgi:alanyl-tRNA synthetase